MNTITWLHLSDLHFQAGEQHTWDENTVLSALLDDIAARIKQDGLQPDFIVVTGDIAFSGKPEEYELARRFFDKLLQRTGLGKDRLFFVPGNHDVNRDLIRFPAKATAEKLTDRDSTNRVLANRKSRQLMFERFEGYGTFANGYFGKHLPFDDERYFYVRTVDLASRRIALLGINSAWLCASDEDKAKGLLIGERQVRMALEQAKGADLKIALMHHPFDWLREFDQNDSASLLTDGCDFVLHGHLHRTGATQLTSPDGTAMILACGACYKTRQYPNMYNWVQLDLTAGTGIVYLRRYSDIRGGFWAKDTLSYKKVDGQYCFEFRSGTGSPTKEGLSQVSQGSEEELLREAQESLTRGSFDEAIELPDQVETKPERQRSVPRQVPKQAWRTVRHPVWKGVGALIAVVALVALGTWLWPDIHSILFPTPTAISFQDFETDNGTLPGIHNYCEEAWFAACSFNGPQEPVHGGDRAISVNTYGEKEGSSKDTGGTIRIKPSSSEPVDLSSANVISVWVYDTQGNNTVETKMQYADGKVSNAVWSPIKSVQDNWTQITWNLGEFTGVDKSRISSIELYEGNDGAYYFDDVTYSWVPQVEFFEDLDLRVFSETFRDEITEHEPRSRRYYAPPAVLRLSTLSPGSDGDEGYKITYGWVSVEHYACWGINLKEPLDISKWSQLSFDIKGEVGNEVPHVWLGSPSPSGDVRNIAVTDWDAELGSQQRVHIPITEAWQRVEVPLESFREQNGKKRTIDPERIQEISICFEWGKAEGAIFVDSVAFE